MGPHVEDLDSISTGVELVCKQELESDNPKLDNADPPERSGLRLPCERVGHDATDGVVDRELSLSGQAPLGLCEARRLQQLALGPTRVGQ